VLSGGGGFRYGNDYVVFMHPPAFFMVGDLPDPRSSAGAAGKCCPGETSGGFRTRV